MPGHSLSCVNTLQSSAHNIFPDLWSIVVIKCRGGSQTKKLCFTICSEQFPVCFITMTLPDDGKNDNTNKLLQMKISLSCLASRALSRLILYHPLNDSLGFLHFSEYQPIIITSNLRPTSAGRKMGKL